jgi:ABC-type transport system involved in multi-copper enzyme maturation permease subunit
MKRLMWTDNMKWLVWKDYRLNRWIVWAAVLLLVAPHVMAAILALRGVALRMDVMKNFVFSGIYSLALLQVVIALFGGNLIAGERADRSAEFMAYLPVSRGRKLVSKLWVGLGLLALVWLPNLAILAIAFPGGADPFFREVWAILLGIAVTEATIFCVAWLFSSMLESATFSACAGLLAPMLVGMCIGWGYVLVDSLVGLPYHSGLVVFACYVGACLLLSAASFAGGTLYYLRRVEP